MASWEPYIAKAYGVEPRPPAATNDLPPLPSAQIQREVDLKLAEREICIVAGHAAMERWRQRQPHAVMSWSRMVRLLKMDLTSETWPAVWTAPIRCPKKVP